MKKFNCTALIFAALLLTVSFSNVRAQNDDAPVDAAQQNHRPARRPNLLAKLNLSAEQIQQIRRLNREQQTLRRQAQQRFLAARNDLDRAIYADALDESAVQTLLNEVQTAQAELVKIKAANELEIRRLLTAEQLVRFREARERFRETLENRARRGGNRSPNQPRQRLFNRQPRLRQN